MFLTLCSCSIEDSSCVAAEGDSYKSRHRRRSVVTDLSLIICIVIQTYLSDQLFVCIV